ncbi:hypothetical protein KIPE111705_35330 [Kibdelosporangium persicum]
MLQCRREQGQDFGQRQRDQRQHGVPGGGTESGGQAGAEGDQRGCRARAERLPAGPSNQVRVDPRQCRPLLFVGAERDELGRGFEQREHACGDTAPSVRESRCSATLQESGEQRGADAANEYCTREYETGWQRQDRLNGNGDRAHDCGDDGWDEHARGEVANGVDVVDEPL